MVKHLDCSTNQKDHKYVENTCIKILHIKLITHLKDGIVEGTAEGESLGPLVGTSEGTALGSSDGEALGL